jgi:hypothetical protein
MNHALFTALNFSVIASSTSAALPVKRSTDVVITACPEFHSLETEQVLEVSQTLIGASVDLSEDGIARATHHLGGFETAIELKGLMVREIVSAPSPRRTTSKAFPAVTWPTFPTSPTGSGTSRWRLGPNGARRATDFFLRK